MKLTNQADDIAPLEQNLIEVKHRTKNYVFQLIVSCLYNHHAILQFKEITVYIHK